jgi:hypothetical protein
MDDGKCKNSRTSMVVEEVTGRRGRRQSREDGKCENIEDEHEYEEEWEAGTHRQDPPSPGGYGAAGACATTVFYKTNPIFAKNNFAATGCEHECCKDRAPQKCRFSLHKTNPIFDGKGVTNPGQPCPYP